SATGRPGIFSKVDATKRNCATPESPPRASSPSASSPGCAACRAWRRRRSSPPRLLRRNGDLAHRTAPDFALLLDEGRQFLRRGTTRFERQLAECLAHFRALEQRDQLARNP